MKTKLLKTLLMRDGRWAAWLLLDVCLPGEQADTLPAWRALVWRTRSVRQDQVDHFWSEPGRVGVVPAVETSLFRITLRRWFGAPVILWRTEVTVQVWASGVVTLQHDHAFADADAARRDFAAHGAELRKTLAGESQYWADLQKADEPTVDATHDPTAGSTVAVTGSHPPDPHGGTTSNNGDQVRRHPAAGSHAGDSIASIVSAATCSRSDVSWLKQAMQALAHRHGIRLGADNDDATRPGLAAVVS